MDSNSIVFRTDVQAWQSNALRGIRTQALLSAIVAALTVLIYLNTEWLGVWPFGLVLAGITAHVVGDWLYFLRRKGRLDQVVLSENKIGVGRAGQEIYVPYTSLKRCRLVSLAHGRTEITIDTIYGYPLVLSDYQRMHELYSELDSRIA